MGVLLGTSVFVMVSISPYHTAAQTLDTVMNQTQFLGKNINPHFNVGRFPSAIAVNDGTNMVYVTNSKDDTVSVIDVNSMKVSTIPVGDNPSAIAVDKASNVVYVINEFSNTVSIINGRNNSWIKNIRVGISPMSIAADSKTNKVYVTNSESNTVSVINSTSGNKISDIPVGISPNDIAINPDTGIVYVTNELSNTVSIINGTTISKITDIPIGILPLDIELGNDKIYVTTALFGYISVINATTNRWITDISVGVSPVAIVINPETNLLYVVNAGFGNPASANAGSGTVSVINDANNKLQSGVAFNVNPFLGGRVKCNNIEVPTNQYFYVNYLTKCIAEPNNGFQFNSWIENLGHNSNRVIRTSTNSNPFLLSPSSFFGIGPKDTSAILNATQFGNFTAAFEKLPPPIPPEYLATLFTIVVTAFIGSWLTPTVIGWRNARKRQGKLDYYHKEIKYLYNDGELDTNDINKLDKIRINITDAYARGEIQREQFEKLRDDASISYREIFKKELDLLKDVPKKDLEKKLDEIKDNLEDFYAKGKLTELHYNLLKDKLNVLKQTSRNKIDDNTRPP